MALNTLGHLDSTSLSQSILLPSNSNKADVQFFHLVRWLEDQVYRAWKFETRVQLFTHAAVFWKGGLVRYLQDLQCPSEYYQETDIENHGGGMVFRYDASTRCRLIFWLIHGALSQVYRSKGKDAGIRVE